MNELKFAVRQLVKTPGFAAVAVITLALGIGGNTAMFTVVNTLLLQPLPWPGADRVVSVWESNQQKNALQMPMAAAQFLDLRREARSFVAMAAWNPATVNLAAGDASPERYAGALVTEDFFKVVGTSPSIGTGFTAENFDAGKDGVTLISQAVWRQRFNGDPDVVGRAIVMNGRSRVVVGVMPPGFQSPSKADFWVPKVFSDFEMEDRDYKGQFVLARLAPRVTGDAAQTEMNTLFAGLRHQFADVLEGWAPMVHPALEDVVRPIRPALLVLMGAVGVVLLMACITVANLLLARGAARQGELGVRAALGAGRYRLAAQSLGESLVIALAGGALGLLFAYGLLSGLLSIAPKTLPRIDQVHLDFAALFFTAAACVVTTLIAGLVPAFHQACTNPLDALRDASARATSRVGWWRRSLVVFQVGATVVVLVTTGLLLRSFDRLLQQRLGFQPEGLLAVRLELPPVKYAAGHRRDQFAEEVLNQLAATPGVESAAASTYLPLQGWPQFIMRLEENPVVRPSDAPATGYTGVTPGYFHTMGMQILKGRGLGSEDREDAPRVCVVNQAFARTHFGEREPLGKRVEVGFAEPPGWMEIVGVVNDTRNAGLEIQPKEQVFVPLRQQPQFLRGSPALSLIVRGNGSADTIGRAIRKVVWSVDKDQPLYLLQPMTQVLATATSQRRFTVTVLGLFAFVALAMAAIGLYGVMAGYVSARAREIGVRMVLGAQRHDMLRLVLNMGAGTLLSGVTFGVLCAIAAGYVLRGQLYETSPSDTLAWLLAISTLIIVGVGACLVPATRAAQLEPLDALRKE